VTVLIDPRASKDIYRGLHFPEPNIPRQARELYGPNTIWPLYDRELDIARLVCRTFDDAKLPLNLKFSYLRTMSPIHLRYLAHMGVQASMSISIIVNKKLWGLISSHNYGSAAGMRISLRMREVCKALGNIASSNVEKLLYSSRIIVKRLYRMPPKASTFAYITSSTSDLLNMFSTEFRFLVIKR
jgi:light-regulated signal transduction histidine kinase (bacteriophytochrome)